jgi:hypothetical protein
MLSTRLHHTYPPLLSAPAPLVRRRPRRREQRHWVIFHAGRCAFHLHLLRPGNDRPSCFFSSSSSSSTSSPHSLSLHPLSTATPIPSLPLSAPFTSNSLASSLSLLPSTRTWSPIPAGIRRTFHPLHPSCCQSILLSSSSHRAIVLLSLTDLLETSSTFSAIFCSSGFCRAYSSVRASTRRSVNQHIQLASELSVEPTSPPS